DLVTFTLLDVSYVNLFFIAYLAIAATCTFGSHILFARRHEEQQNWMRWLAVLFTLGGQYAIGGILSGCLIFYTKSAVLAVSWPFLILLALVFIGNEYFRKYREHLIFQTVLFFFALYAYAIFALPIYIGSIGPLVFAGSTIAAIVLFGGFLYLLYRTGAARLSESIKPILASAAIIVVALVASYATGVVPPLPLALKEGGIYHGLTRQGGDYVLKAEAERPWWNILPQTVHVPPGGTIYAYGAVFAPIRFSTSVVHHWQRYDERSGKWVEEGHVAFPISGGRAEGYRGYSIKENPEPGKWRVSVETLQGQTIGRISFAVERASTLPPLHDEVR
ncbi:MAG TPA: DUF2914 domain-containing protein, partial [Candidatus Paceibacterota bacterium]|nr:DUF2914 domain-containing protein [Candidatus Paceibacterota bacterium]